MLFSSLTFLFIFLPLLLVIYFLAKDKYKNYILLAVSLLFYSWGEPKYIVLMLLSITVNYVLALLLDKKRKYDKLFLIISLIFNIGMLFSFKYLNFFITNINNIAHLNISLFKLTLPIGISFYTFQILSYVVDVYKKEVKVQKNIFNLGTYIAFFPQLIAGPIVRYQTIEEELKTRTHSIEKVSDGLRRFVLGLAKKVIIANNVALIADTIFDSPNVSEYGTLVIILGMLAYTFQIYFDFSGYSDMAIGLGKIFGFTFNENFNYPYVADSVTDFWRRWHISLSSWFRDYVYIPLGGNRVSKLKWIRNILVVWMLTGFWHGASWNFILWGLFYGILLLIEKLLLSKILNKLPKVIRWIYTFIIVNIGWLIFRLESLDTLKVVFKNLFTTGSKGFYNFISSNYDLVNYLPFMVLALIFSFPIYKIINDKLKDSTIYLFIKDIIIIILFVLCVAFLINNSYNPFIYFRF